MIENESTSGMSWFLQRTLYFGLITCFFILTGIVYRDYPTADKPIGPELNQEALAGQALWRENNCQACHQLYGFGGFLGPDLTNVWARMPRARFDKILNDGYQRMPGFHFSQVEINALVHYFQAMDQSGQGTPSYQHPHATTLTDLAVTYGEHQNGLPKDVEAGARLFEQYQCRTCHQSFRSGILAAPDLSLAMVGNSPEQIKQILKSGRGLMPPFAIEGKAADDIQAFLIWLSEHREPLMALDGEDIKVEWSRIPWFSYSK